MLRRPFLSRIYCLCISCSLSFLCLIRSPWRPFWCSFLAVPRFLRLSPQLRVSVTSAVQSTDDDDVRTLATTGLVWLANAWDPMTRVAALSSLLKIYRKRVQAKVRPRRRCLV